MSKEHKPMPQMARYGSSNNMSGRRGELSPWWGKKHKRLPCPHCEGIFGLNMLSLHHGDNCKKNPANKE